MAGGEAHWTHHIMVACYLKKSVFVSNYLRFIKCTAAKKLKVLNCFKF